MFANNLRSYAARTPLSLLWFLSFFLLCALGSPVGPRETLAFVDSSPEAKPFEFETVPPSPSAGGHCRLLVIPVYVLHNKSSVSHPCLTHSHQLQHTGDVPIGTVSRLPSCLLMPVGDNFARLQSPVACAPTHLGTQFVPYDRRAFVASSLVALPACGLCALPYETVFQAS